MNMNELYNQALEHYQTDPLFQYETEHLLKYPNELIYCYENNMILDKFQDWANLQDLLYEKISFDDYEIVHAAFPKINLMSVDSNDFNTIGEIRHFLDQWHESEHTPSTSFFSRMKSMFQRFIARNGLTDAEVQPSSSMDHLPQQVSASDPQYLAAKAYFSKYKDDIEQHHAHHTDELVFCHQHDKSYLSFEYWSTLQDLLDEKITFDESEMLSLGLSSFDLFGMNKEKDAGHIYELKHYLKLYREQEAKEKAAEPPKKPPLTAQIQSASARAAASHSMSHTLEKQADLEH